MSQDLRFLPAAFELTLDRRRQAVQFCGAALALLVLELTTRVTHAAGGAEAVGRLLAFPLVYVVLMATAVLVCASCRQARSRRAEEAFDVSGALARHLLPAATGAAVLFLAAGAAALLVSLLLALGKLHATALAAVSVLLVPLTALMAVTVAMLVLGLLFFPPLAALAGGDLDGLLSQFGQILRTRFFRVLTQLSVALALAALFTGMLLASLRAGEGLLDSLAATFFGEAVHDVTRRGVTGFLHRVEWLLLHAAIATPALVFLNASSYLVLSSAPAQPPAARAFEEEEETWLLP